MLEIMVRFCAEIKGDAADMAIIVLIRTLAAAIIQTWYLLLARLHAGMGAACSALIQ